MKFSVVDSCPKMLIDKFGLQIIEGELTTLILQYKDYIYKNNNKIQNKLPQRARYAKSLEFNSFRPQYRNYTIADN